MKASIKEFLGLVAIMALLYFGSLLIIPYL